MNLSAGRGVAVREFKLTTGHGFADYLLFVDGKAIGVLEAKPQGHTLSGVEVQTEKYSTGQSRTAGGDVPDRFSDLRAVYRRRILAVWPSYRSSSPISRGFNGMRAIPRRTGRGTGSARQRLSRSSSTDQWSLAMWRTRVPRRGTFPSDALMEDVY